MTDLGPLNYFLRVFIDRSDKGLFLSQQKYATDILEHENMLNCDPCHTHVEPMHKLQSTGPAVSDPTLYYSLLGALQYLIFTRPDIVFVVQHICLYMHDPREQHLHALKCILCYICGTIDHDLQIHMSPSANLVAYSDVDWGGGGSTRRSTSGYCTFLGDNLIL